MNSRQLQYVILLSKVRNYSQAADQLGISQPALSKQILSLESELGIKLFDRDHVPLSLTPAGEYFVRKAQAILYEEHQLIKALEQYKSGENGRLDIGITPFRSLYLMPRLIRQIKERYPGVQVVLHEVNSAQLRKDAVEGKYDLSIVNLPVDDSVLDITMMEPDTLVLAVPQSMADKLTAKAGTPYPAVDFADCSNLPFVVVGQSQEMRQLFDKLCALSDIHPTLSAEVVGISTAWAMTRAGIGATLLPLQFIEDSFFCENIALFTIADNTYIRQPVIVTKRGQYISEYAQFAIDFLRSK